MEKRINLEYLQKEGFKKDTTAPEKVNRWEKTDGRDGGHGVLVANRTYFVSVTLTEDGSETLYGVENFYDGAGYIIQHRYFNGVISVEDFVKFIDRNEQNLPQCVRKFPEQ